MSETSNTSIKLSASEFLKGFVFTGSVKQVSWAESIAKKNLETIQDALDAEMPLPTRASFWIDNQNTMEEPHKLIFALAWINYIKDYEVTEDERKDTLAFMKSFEITGSEPQLKWIKGSILDNLDGDNIYTLDIIANARRLGVNIPANAGFWCDNKSNLYKAFNLLIEIKALNITAAEKSDAVIFADKIDLVGVSDKQTGFARSVVNENTEAIAYALRVGAQIPNTASFWCDNKKNIWGALGLIENQEGS